MKKFWTWNGRKLAPPLMILRRIAAMPFIFLLRGLLFLAVLAGWGLDAAKDNWHMSA